MRAEILSFVTLGGFALGLPTPEVDRVRSARQATQSGSGLPGLGGLGDLPGLGGLGGGGSDGSSGGLGGLGDLPGLGGLGGSDGSSGGLGGLGDIPGLGGLGGSDGSSGGLGGLGDIPGLGGLGGSSNLAASDSAGSDSSASSGGLGDLGSMIPSLGGGSSTENGITDNEACQPLTFIFARGTTETGNMGSVVGPPVAKALRSSLNDKVTVQGVDYPASAGGNAAMGAEGGPEMEKLAKQAISQCPDTKIALGGYSQGAMVVHNAAKSLDQVAAAVVFGDPLKTMPIGSVPDGKVKGFCATGDPVCANGANFMAHISYGGNAEEAAKFIVQAAGAQ